MRTARLSFAILISCTIGVLASASAAENEVADAERGDVKAQFLLGLGHVAGTNNAEAAKWFRLAGEQGLTQAQLYLGYFHRDGDGVPQSHEEAAKWFRRAAELGNGDAQFSLGQALEDGMGVRRDDAESAKWLRLAAAQGVVGAQVLLATRYIRQQGTPNVQFAYMWFSAAVAAGKEAAKGSDGEKNGQLAQEGLDTVKKAMRPAEIRRATELSNRCTETRFTECGDTLPQQIKEFVALRLAAEADDPDALLALARVYDFGRGVPKSDGEAAWLYFKAAASGNKVVSAAAFAALGRLQLEGRGLPRSEEEAAKLFYIAARQGVAEAQASLGAMFFNGQGVPQDRIRAYMWLDAAAGSSPGSELGATALRSRDALAAQLSPDEMALAQAVAARCKSNPEQCR